MKQAATFETFLWTVQRQLELYQYVKSLKAFILHSYFLFLRMTDAFLPGFRTQRYRKLVMVLYVEKNYIPEKFDVLIRKHLPLLYMGIY